MFESLSFFIVGSILGLDPASKLAQSLNFLIADTVKIYVLIFIVINFVGLLRTFVDQQKIKRSLQNARFGLGYLGAAIFGAVTPFCSCSSIPLFLGFIEAGISPGIAFAFLATSPLVNEIVLVLMGGMFGWHVALIYAGAGILLGIGTGILIDKLNLGKEIILKAGTYSDNPFKTRQKNLKLKERLAFAKNEWLKIFKKIWWVIIIGVGLGAALHGYVPQDFLERFIASTTSVFAVPLAVLVGVPIYAGCSTVVPVIFVATLKGASLGTALAFLMSVAGLSLPEALILKRALSLKLLLIFFGIVTFGIIAIGYLFNLLQL